MNDAVCTAIGFSISQTDKEIYYYSPKEVTAPIFHSFSVVILRREPVFEFFYVSLHASMQHENSFAISAKEMIK